MSVTSGVRHLLRRLNKWRLRTWYSKGCWQDSTSADTSVRQGWIYGEGSRPDTQDESHSGLTRDEVSVSQRS